MVIQRALSPYNLLVWSTIPFKFRIAVQVGPTKV